MAGSPDSDAIEIPLPTGGMNTDTSPSQLDPVEAVYIKNLLLTEPTQMRRRRGWKRNYEFASTMGGTPGTSFPVSVVPVNAWKNAIIFTADSGATLDAWVPPYFLAGPDASAPSGYSTTAPTIRGNFANGSGGSFSYAGAGFNAWGNEVAAYGRAVNYDNLVFWVSAPSVASGLTKVNGTTQSGPRIVVANGSSSPAVMGTSLTVNGTINRDSTTITFSAAPGVTNVTGKILLLSSPTPPYKYLLHVKAHTTGVASATLFRPYGAGESATDMPSVTVPTAVTYQTWHYLINSPPWAACIAMYKDRMFAGRGFMYNQNGAGYAGYYANVIQWSYPGNWQKWPDNYFAFVDEDFSDPIMSMQPVNDTMLIWKRGRTYVMSGYDETTFQLDRLFDRVGCIHDLSVVNYEDRVYWCGERGIYSSNGSDLRNEASRNPGKGVLVDYLPLIERDSGAKNKFPSIYPVSGIVGDHYVLAIHDARSAYAASYYENLYAMNLKTGAWSKWGTGAGTFARQPVHFFTMFNQSYAVMKHYIVNIDKVFREEDSSTAAADAVDQDYDTSGNTESNMVTFNVTFRDWIPAPSYTVRFREMAIDHSSFYVNGSQSARNSYTVTLAKDADLTSATTVEDVAARRQTSYNASTYYTDRFLTNTWQQEGSVFRLKITNSADAGLYCDSVKFYRVRVLLDKTRWSRVDNPVT